VNEVRTRVQEVFRSVFSDPSIELRDDMTAEDIEGWDSLAHINLIVALERGLGINFATAEISRMKEPGETVGSLTRLVEAKVAKR
jgi:acyl carrier protein